MRRTAQTAIVLVFFFFSAMFIRAAKPTARMTPQRAMRTMGRVSSIVAGYVSWLVTFPESVP